MTKVASFEIHYSRFLDPAGAAVAELPAFARDPKALIPLYRGMVLTRRFDAKAVALQRTGRLGTYASSLGQEAVTVGLARGDAAGGRAAADLSRGRRAALARRAHGRAAAVLGRRRARQRFPGAARPISRSACRSRANACMRPASPTPSSSSASRGAAVCVCGDGATSKGDFYEAINSAGVWRVPAVFVINNNSGRSRCRARRRRRPDAGAEGDRRRPSRRAGRRQRRDRGAPARSSRRSSARAAARGRA